MIKKKGGVKEFHVLDLMEWFMKSQIDILNGIDYAMTHKPTPNWPRWQTLKELFANIVKPIEKLVVWMYPLPQYKIR